MGSYVDLAGRRYLVTGASSGIGRQTAIELSGRGASVVISGRDGARLQETFDALAPGDHLAVQGDLTSATHISALVDATGALDGVVHSAGRNGLAPVKLLSEKFLDEVMAANFKSTVMLTQRLLAKNRIKNGGSIAVVLSIAAHTGTSGVGPYTASKGALLAFIRPLAMELAAKKIRVNGLSPAIVRTPIFKPEDADWLIEQEKRYPLGLGRPEDVAYGAVFLLSDASRYITGTTIIMDGGCGWI